MTDISLPVLEFRDYQKPLWNYMMQERSGLRAGTVWPRRNGKDLAALNILIAKAMQRPGLYFYIAPYATQVRTIIWEGMDGTGKRFLDYIPSQLITRKLDQIMKLWLVNGSMIQLLGSDNVDAIVGSNPLGIVFTEYSLHKDVVWGYMRPILSENGGWALFNGTPRGMNHFYSLAQMAKNNPSWFYERLTADDTGYPSKEAIQDERDAGMPESLIEQEYYTSWTASTEETLIPLDIVKPCVGLDLPESAYKFAPRIIGVDPAYAEKGDRAVIARRQGRMVFPFEVYQGKDPMALASRVAMVIKEWKPHAVFIDAGRGEAIWSRLHQLGYQDRVFSVDFGGASYDELCRLKKDEMWNRAKDYIASPLKPSLPADEDFIRDLTAPMYMINDRGKLEVESKKSLRRRGFRSTDLADAFILTHAEEFDETDPMPSQLEQLGLRPDQAGRLVDMAYEVEAENAEYNPLGYMNNRYYGFTTNRNR